MNHANSQEKFLKVVEQKKTLDEVKKDVKEEKPKKMIEKLEELLQNVDEKPLEELIEKIKGYKGYQLSYWGKAPCLATMLVKEREEKAVIPVWCAFFTHVGNICMKHN